MNIPISRDSIGYVKEKINKYNYKFPVLYADSVTKQFGFNATPHLIIIKNGEVRFNGHPVLEENVLVNNLYDEIEVLLKEGF